MKDYLSKIAERVFGRDNRASETMPETAAETAAETMADIQSTVPTTPGMSGIGYLPGSLTDKMRGGPLAEDLDDAIKSGDLAKVAELVNLGANVHAPDANGITPLQLAVSNGQKDIADILKAVGALDFDSPEQRRSRERLSNAHANRMKKIFISRHTRVMKR